ncbi:hypothetical protein G6F24_015948 [Rhizopus arrhizus]|nr:hypothetical protein G6F24_015948 [Rhizopus arrhizus]
MRSCVCLLAVGTVQLTADQDIQAQRKQPARQGRGNVMRKEVRTAQLLADAEPLVRLPADGGALRLQTMCPGPLSWQRMEELERAGAQGLMVLSVERSLA